MPEPIDTSRIEQALRALGEQLTWPADVEVLLVGGAAAMITGLLPPERTTLDCDVMLYSPPDAEAAVERAADEIAADLGLPERWFNSDVRLRQDTLPDGWQTRRILVGQYGRLRVCAASRLDLIAMKVVAGRAQDIEDLELMQVRRDEAEFVHVHLAGLEDKGTHADQVRDAFDLLESLTLHEL